MVLSSKFLALLAGLTAVTANNVDFDARAPADPCAVIGGKKWVSPKEVRACYSSIKVDQTLKNNVRPLQYKHLYLHPMLMTATDD